jgi:hypothetical protein
MTGRHEAAWIPDTEPSGYPGRHRAAPVFPTFPAGIMLAQRLIWPLLDDPRCQSCGHPFEQDCGCVCCYDNHEETPRWLSPG